MRVTDYHLAGEDEGEMRLPRLGKIGLGVRVKATEQRREHPDEVEFFVLDDPACLPIIQAAEDAGKIDHEEAGRWSRGENGPRRLPILLCHEDEAVICPRALEKWGGNRTLICRGNGTVATQYSWAVDGKSRTEAQIACPCWELGPEFGQPPPIGADGKVPKPGCARVLRLYVMVPRADISGVFQIDTRSQASIGNIRRDLAFVRSVFGRISMLWAPATGETVLYLARQEWVSTRDKRKHFALRIIPRSMPYQEALQLAGPAPAPLQIEAPEDEAPYSEQ